MGTLFKSVMFGEVIGQEQTQPIEHMPVRRRENSLMGNAAVKKSGGIARRLQNKKGKPMSAILAPKQVRCKCGHSFETTKPKSWCEKCCRPVFYHEKDQRKHQFNTYYMITMVLMVMMFIAYIFIEMIARPLLSL